MKRSEFYAMFITMIVLFTASVSFAVSYQPQIIQPTKPYQKSETFTSTADTAAYYTMLDTVSGAGSLNKINVYTGNTNVYIFIKITVDGVPYIVSGPATDGAATPSAGIYVYHSSAIQANYKSLVFHGPIYFKNSLKVEVRINLDGTSGETTIDYALE